MNSDVNLCLFFRPALFICLVLWLYKPVSSSVSRVQRYSNEMEAINFQQNFLITRNYFKSIQVNKSFSFLFFNFKEHLYRQNQWRHEHVL